MNCHGLREFASKISDASLVGCLSISVLVDDGHSAVYWWP